MPGRTGKRSRPPKPCARCGLRIEPDRDGRYHFCRDKKLDYHIACWQTMYEEKATR